LTTLHWRAGKSQTRRYVLLGGERLALTRGVVHWDGRELATLEEAFEKLTFKNHDDKGNITFAFFRTPLLLQVDLAPREGFQKSLEEIQQSTADR
jgi:hypothetical protein